MLLFFGLMRGLTHQSDSAIITLACWAVGLATAGIYGRSILLFLGRSMIHGIARDNER